MEEIKRERVGRGREEGRISYFEEETEKQKRKTENLKRQGNEREI